MRKVLVEKYEESVIEGGRKTFFDKNGDYHRFNDLPAIDSINVCMWSVHGDKHRRYDEPSVIIGLYGFVLEHQFWFKGKLHREGDKPAIIKKSIEKHMDLLRGLTLTTHTSISNSEIIYEESDVLSYYKNGLLHREGKPAKINGNFHYYYENGILKEKKVFYINKFVDYIFYNPISFAFLISLLIVSFSMVASFIFSST